MKRHMRAIAFGKGFFFFVFFLGSYVIYPTTALKMHCLTTGFVIKTDCRLPEVTTG